MKQQKNIAVSKARDPQAAPNSTRGGQPVLGKNSKAQLLSGQSRELSGLNVALADLLFTLHVDQNEDCAAITLPEQARKNASRLLNQKKSESPKFIGIVGKCMIPGCDIHTLTFAGDIIQHYKEQQKIDGPFAAARNILRSSQPSVVGVLVYDSLFEVIFIDGSVRTVTV